MGQHLVIIATSLLFAILPSSTVGSGESVSSSEISDTRISIKSAVAESGQPGDDDDEVPFHADKDEYGDYYEAATPGSAGAHGDSGIGAVSNNTEEMDRMPAAASRIRRETVRSRRGFVVRSDKVMAASGRPGDDEIPEVHTIDDERDEYEANGKSGIVSVAEISGGGVPGHGEPLPSVDDKDYSDYRATGKYEDNDGVKMTTMPTTTITTTTTTTTTMPSTTTAIVNNTETVSQEENSTNVIKESQKDVQHGVFQRQVIRDIVISVVAVSLLVLIMAALILFFFFKRNLKLKALLPDCMKKTELITVVV